MYVEPNVKSRKELKDLIDAGKTVTVFSPGPFPCPTEGVVTVEGPHYPKPHRWYGQVLVKDGIVIKVLK